ncbi:MAG: hypothetical protein IPM29_05485 [Planctomycetes bacterium]|nr:hypothetical protein [Planctomycetota bacterium]
MLSIERALRWSLLAGLCGAAGCASTEAGAGGGAASLRAVDVRWHELWPELADGPTVADQTFRAREPSPALRAGLRTAAQTWVDGDAARFAELRDGLVGDPLAAFWLTRWMILRMVDERRLERRDDDAALIAQPAWRRTFDAVVEIGAPAAPCVVLDLLRPADAVGRELGAELLTAIGQPALPALRRVLDVEDERVRRAAVQVVAGLEPTPETRAILDAAARDPRFGVRAQAWRGFVHGAEDAARLRAALATESDPFVRIAIVETLGAHRDVDSARALLTELERALAADDARMVEASRDALQDLAGRSDLTSLAALRAWVDSLTTAAPDGLLDTER